MRVPTNMSLREWIISLVQVDKLYWFYKTPEWIQLKTEVLEDHHWECVRCEERGRYSRAQTVHHVYEVKKHPEMALTRWIEDPVTGEREEVLLPLCNRCHNDVHGRTLKGSPKKPQLNEERFD